MILETAWYNKKHEEGVPKYVRLYGCIRAEIEKGNIQADQSLPSIRQVSKGLMLSSTTVENAYNQLMVEGYIYSIPRKGYYVAPIDKTYLSTGQTECLRKRDVERPGEWQKYIDTDMFRFDEWKRAYSHVLENNQSRLLWEGDPQGEIELRQALSDYLYRARGVLCEPGQIVIGSGVQTLLHIFCDIAEGIGNRKVAFEEPGFTDVRPVFKKRGFLLQPIALEQNGIQVDALIRSKANLCYISPSHQYPTGLVMPIQKRVELLKWADRTKGYILEDDYDSELRFSGKPVPPLFGLDNSGRVVYIGSFSTLLLPSLRISFMILPDSLKMLFSDAAHQYRSTVSTVEQLALAEYLNEGLFERHLRRMRKKCAEKLKSFVSALSPFQNDLKLHKTDTGTFVLLEAKDEEIAAKIRCHSRKAGFEIQEIWERFFLLHYVKHGDGSLVSLPFL